MTMPWDSGVKNRDQPPPGSGQAHYLHIQRFKLPDNCRRLSIYHCIEVFATAG